MTTFRVAHLDRGLGGQLFPARERVYALRVGELRAHRIGVTTRIVDIFVFACFLAKSAHVDSVPDFLLAGTYWPLIVLGSEWVGNFIPVHEILDGGTSRRARCGHTFCLRTCSRRS
jgi:hypothetical protein